MVGTKLAVEESDDGRRCGSYTMSAPSDGWPVVKVLAVAMPSGVRRLEVRFFGWGWVIDEIVFPNQITGRNDERTNLFREIVDALLDGWPLEMAFDRLLDILPEDHPFCRAMAAGCWKGE